MIDCQKASFLANHLKTIKKQVVPNGLGGDKIRKDLKEMGTS